MLSSIAQHFNAPTNRLYALRDELRAKGTNIIDLVSGNVNCQGIIFPEPILKQALQKGIKKSRIYKPHPLGQMEARRAISRYYVSEGLKISPDQLIVTPGTSISYAYAFKVLADPGDEMLCPVPCYPLFDSIAALCRVRLVPYRLEEKDRWRIDLNQLESSITPRTKGIVLISPHNPTGSVATMEDIHALAGIAKRKRLAIISDEVFSPFLFKLKCLPRPAATDAPLVLTLNGFSKMLALPGLKIGWMAITGEPALVGKTMKALDMISDTFLPVNEATQFAVPQVLSGSRKFQTWYAKEIQERMSFAVNFFEGQKGISFVKPEGGFFLTLRLKVSLDEEMIALRLLKDSHLLVHPGYFYDMGGQHLVLSFISKPSVTFRALRVIADILANTIF